VVEEEEEEQKGWCEGERVLEGSTLFDLVKVSNMILREPFLSQCLQMTIAREL